MTVQELIDALSALDDKSMPVMRAECGWDAEVESVAVEQRVHPSPDTNPRYFYGGNVLLS